MIYIKNTTEIQTVFIPRNELQKEAYVTSTKTYEDGYREGLEDGKEYQKDHLLNLYVTENGQYEREDGWGVVTVDISTGDCPECEECPEGGSCNIQPQKHITLNEYWETHYPDEGYDGIYEVVVDAVQRAEEWREEGKWEIRDSLQTIEITENGRYSIDDEYHILYLDYEGGYHTDTISTYDINRIEVTFRGTSKSIYGEGQPFILGGSKYGVNESGEDNECARAIQYAYGGIVGYWEGKWTDAVSTMDWEWLTITLDENGMTVKYPTYERYCEYTHDNGKSNVNGESFPFIIGGQGRKSFEDGNNTSSLIEGSKFRGGIKEVKITTNSMGEITYIPNGLGVWQRMVENAGEYLSALEPTEGKITLTVENGKKYGEGWRDINVNIDTGAFYNEGFNDGYNEGLIQSSNNVLEGDMIISFQLNDNNFPDLRNDGEGLFFWDGYKIPLYIQKPNGYGELYLSGSYDNNSVPDIFSRFFEDDGYAKIEKLTINVWHIVPDKIVNVVNLKELHLTENVENVDKNAFQDCVNLKTIYCHFDNPNIYMYTNKESFVGLPNNGTLYVKESQQPAWAWIEDLGWTIVNI